MTEIVRDRDVITIVKGNSQPVMVTDAMAAQGWAGGQAVTWADSPHDELLVTFSDGTYGGFLLWGSDEVADARTALSTNQPTYKFAILGCGTWIISTTTYEKYTYASRQSGPLVPLTYSIGQRLTFSLRGYWTNEDEWTLSSDPRAPNNYYVGYVAQVPSEATSFYMTIQTSI